VRTQQVDGQFLPSKIKIFCGSGYSSPFSREAYTVIEPSQAEWQALGVEDPRIALLPDNNTLLMFYTAVNTINAPQGSERAMLALASCVVSTDPQCRNWTLHGPVFPESLWWSKSGALLVRPAPPHYLFWGDSSICIATTSDFFNYSQTSACLVTPRADSFDSVLVESGPPPMQLDDGNFIFLYNSARNGNIPNPKVGWNLQYNLGFVILNGSNPTDVLQRATEPILSPQLSWETCDDSNYVPGATPDVVFVNGAKKVDGSRNTWIVYYQGCDTRMGLALLTVA
jgi:predicted GH43/DUF377 family glycosyl hydrolase